MISDRERIHRLFFALCPDSALLEKIGHTTQELKSTRHVRGRWLQPDKLHVTVQFLGDFLAADEVIARARDGADKLRCAPFEFVLDRAETFPRRSNPPCVLRCAPAQETALRAFALQLGDALGVAGLAEHVDVREYIPHLTIAYLDDALSEPIPIRPIAWEVREFWLMNSLVGTGRYDEIARWPLRA